MSLGERLREMLDPGATAGSSGTNGTSGPPSGPPRRRSRSQAQPINPVRSYDTGSSPGMPRAQWIGLGLAAALAVALTAGLVFVVLTMVRPGAQPVPTPTPLPVLASPTVPSSVAQIFATSTPPPNAPTPTPQGVGQRLVVANTGPEGVNLRRDPGQGGERIKTLADGSVVEVIAPDRTVDGIIWKNVRDAQGEVGWIAGSYLAAEGSVPAAGIPGSSLGPVGGTPAAAATSAAPRPTTAVAPSSASRGQVGNTNGQGANIRSEPGTGGRILKTLPEGANIEVLGEEREVDGQVWRRVRDTQSGVTGWIVRGAVAPAGSVATPVPVTTRAPASGGTPAPAAKPSTGSGSSGTSATPGAKPTTPPSDLPVIIQPATPRAQTPQVTAPPPSKPSTGGTPPRAATPKPNGN
jgi:SH3-like domain-containing protein